MIRLRKGTGSVVSGRELCSEKTGSGSQELNLNPTWSGVVEVGRWRGTTGSLGGGRGLLQQKG